MNTEMKNPFENTIAVALHQHSFGLTRKVRGEARAIDREGGECPKEAIALSKRLLRSSEYDAITSLDAAVRRRLAAVSVPSVLQEAVVLVSYELFPRVQRELEDYQKIRTQKVAEFLSAYDKIVDDARVALGPLFDRRQYPSAESVSKRFSVEVRYVTFGVSEGLRSIDAQLFEREKQRLEASMDEAGREIRSVMRAGLAELVDHLHERLTGTGENGRPKILRESAVDNVLEWLNLFSVRNVTNDTELAALVDKCRNVLGKRNIESLRAPGWERREVGNGLREVKRALDELVAERPARKFFFDEGEG